MINLTHNDRNGSMVVHRLEAPADLDSCPAPENVHTAKIDGGAVYGTDEAYLNKVLREPNSCKLRESDSQMLPITSSADEQGRFFFIAGDLRVDEHGLLTCMHTVWLPYNCSALIALHEHGLSCSIHMMCPAVHLTEQIGMGASVCRCGCVSTTAYVMKLQNQRRTQLLP